jgi:hypothetical protein
MCQKLFLSSNLSNFMFFFELFVDEPAMVLQYVQNPPQITEQHIHTYPTPPAEAGPSVLGDFEHIRSES